MAKDEVTKSVEAAFADLQKRFKNSSLIEQEFFESVEGSLGYQRRSVLQWLNGDRRPQGERLVYFGLFLNKEYEYSIFSRIDPDILRFLRRLYQGRISFDELSSDVGIPRTDLIEIFLGRRLASDVEKEILSGLFRGFVDDAQYNLTGKQIVDMLVSLSQVSEPLIRRLLDSSSAEDRSMLHEKMGFGGVYDYANLWNQLCSEDARNKMSKNSKRGDK